jgi:uncharacterized protein (TIGR02588 family)
MKKKDLTNRLKEITLLEWIVSITGTLIFFFTLSFVLYNAVTNSHSPADINIRVLSFQPNGNDFLLNIEVENKGDASVEGLEIAAILQDNESEIERGVTTFDYVPGRSKRKGGIFFKKNPGDYQIQLRPLGFEEP